MTFRVYMNGFDAAPLIWSVDEGSAATERKVQRVEMVGAVYAVTVVNLKADNRTEPRAWLAVKAEELHIENDIAILRSTEEKSQ